MKDNDEWVGSAQIAKNTFAGAGGAAIALSLCIVIGIAMPAPSKHCVLRSASPHIACLVVIANVVLLQIIFIWQKVGDILRAIQVSNHLKMKTSYLPKSIHMHTRNIRIYVCKISVCTLYTASTVQ